MQPIAIAGIGRTDYDPKPGIPIPLMVHQAVQAALNDAALTLAQIDAIVTASVDLYDGLTASNIAVTEVVGAVLKPESRIAGDGLLAVCQGVMAILSGSYKRVLIVAHCKTSMGDRQAIGNWTVDPIYQQPLGLDDRAVAMLQAAVIGDHSMGACLPAPPSDGAAALILSAESAPVTVRGMGWALDEHYPGDRDLSGSPALREAARRACALAGITAADLSFAGISDHFHYQRKLWMVALGLTQTVEIDYLAEKGVPPFVAGLDRLIEAVIRLRRKSGLGLVQGCWGPAGQGQVVMVVGR